MPADRHPDHRAGHSPTTGAAGRPDPARVDPVRAEVEQNPDGRAAALVAEQGSSGPATTRAPAPQALQRLQGAAGNRAVAALVAQRRRPAPATRQPVRPAKAAKPAGGAAASPVQRLATGGATETSTGRAGPESDPKFAALKADIHGKQKLLSAHPSPSSEASRAQGAAKPPQDDKEAQGKTANAEKMNAAKPGEFDKAAFIKAVNDAIAQQAPKNLDEADKFGDSGKAADVKAQVQGKVTDGKKTSAAAITTTTNAPPDTAAAVEKPVTPLQPDQPPATPGTPDPAKAIPDKAPASATDFSAGPKQVNDQMADAQVTEDQLKKGNQPEFNDALAAKKDGEQHAATAPGQIRGKEATTLDGAKAQAQQTGATAMTALATDRKQAGAQVQQGKEGAKGSDESKRAQVTAKLQTVFDATKKDVEDILTGLDKKVDDTFTTGEKAARDAFTAEHKTKMDAYKDKRYSGWTGKLRWVKDKFAGLPEEANQIFVVARQGYVTRMQGVISSVADVIGAELGRAKARIATGRDQLQAEVKKLPADLQAIGKQAAGDFSGQFDSLTESVDSKGNELVNTLATKYNDALKSVDEEIDAEKQKNEGLVAKAVNAVKGVIDTILKLKDLLLGVLAKAASAVAAIIKDPIGFLGHLVDAVGAGLKNFIANIGTHLQKGLIGWLMGNLASAGLQLPDKFDLRGILGMIASLLGLTWQSIRGRIVSRGVPDQAMTAVEQSVPIAQKIQSGGIGAIWEEIKEKIGDLKANLFGKISEYLIPTILVAGITWIVSLLNPASAFIKACKMIIDIVTFILDRGAQIIAFVNSILDAIIAIAGGGAGGVPALIEDALAKSIPVLIGALAAILGVSGIADKIKAFIQSLSKPVMKAVDWVVDKIVGFGKKIWSKMKGFGKKIKDKLTGGGKDKDKAPGPDGSKPVTSLALSESVSMAGEGHTVFANTRDGKVVVEMASARRVWVGGLIQSALAQEQAGQRRSDLIRYLTAMNGRVRDIEQLEQKDLSEAKKAKIEEDLVEMTRALYILGTTFGMKSLTDFTKSKYVVDGKLDPKYATGKAIRATFYPDWDAAALAHAATQKADLRQRKQDEKAIWGTDPLFAKSTSYVCPGNGVTKPHLTDAATTTGRQAIDHTFEVSAQWNKTGHNTAQPPRDTFYNDTTNHQVMCTSCNGSKSGPDFIPDIGPNFRGPGDAP